MIGVDAIAVNDDVGDVCAEPERSRMKSRQSSLACVRVAVEPDAADALFPVADSPRFLKIAMYFNPLSYGVDGLRGALTHGFVFGPAVDLAALGVWAALTLAAGSYFFSKIRL